MCSDCSMWLKSTSVNETHFTNGSYYTTQRHYIQPSLISLTRYRTGVVKKWPEPPLSQSHHALQIAIRS